MSDKDQDKHSVTIKLQYPIKWDQDEPIKEVTLKRPKGKHLRYLSAKPGVHDLLQIAAKVSGHTPSFFDEMDAVDCLKITEVIGDFLDDGQETETSA